MPVSNLRGNRDLIKAMNRSLLLNIIRQEGAISRTMLTDLSGLSVGAVSQIVTELLNNGWIYEGGEGDYTGGRRQTLLRLNADAGYAVGLKVMENRVIGAVTNLQSAVLHYAEIAIPPDRRPEAVSEALAEAVEQLIAESQVAHERLLGVGIGLAGVIYSQTGVVHYSPFFDWHDVPLAETLGARLNLPVYVENDVNTLTITEHLFGAGKHQANFVVLTIGRGIGMGMFINGQLYQGARGGAGEIGHLFLSTNDKPSTLELLAADPAVIRQYAYRTGQANQAEHGLSIAEIAARAAAGDAIAQDVLARSGDTLGMGLAAVVNILSPAMIIISGEGVLAGEYRLKPMQDALRRYTFNGLLDGVEVLIEPTDDQAWARGAAALAISKVFMSPLVERAAVG